MLVETIKELFTKWIYKRHKHNWIFQEKKTHYENILFETSRNVYVYKCACGKIKIIKPDYES